MGDRWDERNLSMEKTMYYHIMIRANEKYIFELDLNNLDEIINDTVVPYLIDQEINVNGYVLRKNNIIRFFIGETEKSFKKLKEDERNKRSGFIIQHHLLEKVAKDITRDILKEAKLRNNITNPEKSSSDNKKIFIVHGRDSESKISVARFIEQLGLEAIILHEQPNAGKTIIEKIEEHTDVGFAIVLYTPCDLGGLKESEEQKPRARQNVVFEHGYLIAKLGRNRVCALVKKEVEFPSDINGIVYYIFDDNDAWEFKVARELQNAGYQIDMNKIK